MILFGPILHGPLVFLNGTSIIPSERGGVGKEGNEGEVLDDTVLLRVPERT